MLMTVGQHCERHPPLHLRGLDFTSAFHPRAAIASRLLRATSGRRTLAPAVICESNSRTPLSAISPRRAFQSAQVHRTRWN